MKKHLNSWIVSTVVFDKKLLKKFRSVTEPLMPETEVEQFGHVEVNVKYENLFTG